MGRYRKATPPLSNKEKQARKIAKKKENGLVLFQAWVKPAWKKAMQDLKKSLAWRDEQKEIRIPIKPGNRKPGGKK